MRGPDFHAGGKAGSWIPYVIPNSVRHPMRDHLRATCFIRCGTPPYLGSEVNGGPLGGVPPSLDIPAPRSAFFIENFCVWRNCLDPPPIPNSAPRGRIETIIAFFPGVFVFLLRPWVMTPRKRLVTLLYFPGAFL